MLLTIFPIFSQSGSVLGTIKDEETGELLTGATIVIKGTTRGTISDFDGNYELSDIEAGETILVCSFVSYEPIEKKVRIISGESIKADFSLSSAQISLDEVQVTAKANRENETMLLLEQKNAAVITESIGALELSNKGVSNAADAATKITGVTRQEGTKTLNVRGLGDRYNTTTLNGLPLPSNNSERKNIDLSLFNTDIISHINIEKTFTPLLYGDFAGANINIVTKNLIGDKFFKINVKGGINTSLFETDNFYLQNGPDMFGFYKENLPDVNSIDNERKYDFRNSLNPLEKNIIPDLGLGISGGNSYILRNSNKLNLYYTASFDSEQSFTDRIDRVVSGSDLPLNDLKGEEFNYTTQTTGMLNLNYSAKKAEIYFNSLILNSTEQTFTNIKGKIRDVGDEALRRNAEFTRNFVIVNQLLGDHSLNNNTEIHWALAYNNVTNSVPDRFRTTFTEYDPSTNIGRFDTEAAGINYRYFQSFKDDEYASNIIFEKNIGKPVNEKTKHKAKLSFGYSGRYKLRSFESNQFDHAIYVMDENNRIVPIEIDVDHIDNYINNDNFLNDNFRVNVVRVNDDVSGFTYDGTIFINALFGALEYNISSKLMILLGGRIENVYQEIRYISNQTGPTEKSSDFNEMTFLPSLAMRYSLNEKNNLRFTSSKTYTLPQLQEMPLIVFDGITDRTYGNPWLYPSTVYNAELKWEMFPKANELFSVSAFGKYIEDPINKFVTFGFLNEYVNANTGDWAYVYGIELDLKKDVLNVENGDRAQKIFVTGNITYMNTEQELNSRKIIAETDNTFYSTFQVDKEILQGAAPLIYNASIGHNLGWKNNEFSITSVLIYNYVSERLFAIGHSSLGNRMDQPINTLDIVFKTHLKNFDIGFKAKNLLNQQVDRIQENQAQDWLVYSYKKGISFSLQVSYKIKNNN